MQYTKLDQVSHILKRPDMYIGSLRPATEEHYITKEDNTMEMKSFLNSPALIRLFVEALSNATDHAIRHPECTSIKVSLNDEKITVWNNGPSIPIVKNEEGVYIPTMIFGEFLTSSNYDDTEDRMVVGRNGWGIKIVSCLSSLFEIEIVNPEQGLKFKQRWTNHLCAEKPNITKSSRKVGYVQVSWVPDFELFGVPTYSQDMIALIRRYVFDTAITSTAKLYLNNTVVPVKSLKQYAQCFPRPTNDLITFETDDCSVAVTTSSVEEQVSFVNGQQTSEGGKHVDAWRRTVLGPLASKIGLNIKEVRPFFRFIVVARLANPEFGNQNKTKLTHPTPKASITPQQISKMYKWDIVSDIRKLVLSKDNKKLTKISSRGVKTVKGLDHANKAGTKESRKCSLILCEGDSAKTFAVSGMDSGINGVKGRDYLGVFALRGKVLNTRKASNDSISNNREVTSIIQGIGLRIGVDYTVEENFNKLNYGTVILLADADCDGVHISSLIINMFHSLFPSLLERPEPYLVIMRTPLVKCTVKNKTTEFYSQLAFEHFRKRKNIKAKYYKGLGTSTRQEARASFGKKQLNLVYDNNAADCLYKIFGNNSQLRKDWLEDAKEQDLEVPETSVNHPLPISDYLNIEMIKFSLEDCKRSIPTLQDGLKVSQRKILYACFKRGLEYNKDSMKVAQLGGYIASVTQYHHGEQNLYETITKMAQDFIGSNNIPLLFPDGEFGSRICNGSDAASPRYIFTKLAKLTRTIFRSEDDPILEYLEEDGEQVEPRQFYPIIPMILVNGVTAGIGTGWSTSIPNYNPKDCIQWCLDRLYDKKSTVTLTPYYNDFKGTIEQEDNGRFTTRGILDGNVVRELPVGMSTDKFKEKLDKLIDEKKIRRYDNHSTCEEVLFTIKGDTTHLKLDSTINVNNIVLFNNFQSLHKYADIDELLEEFFEERLSMYVRRRSYQLKEYASKITRLVEKIEFIQQVVDGTVDLRRTDLNAHLSNRKTKDLLLVLPINQFSQNMIDKLLKELDTTRDLRKTLKETTAEGIWIRELHELSNSL